MRVSSLEVPSVAGGVADMEGVLPTVIPVWLRNDIVGSGGLVHGPSLQYMLAFPSQQLIPQSMFASPLWLTVILKGTVSASEYRGPARHV